MWKIPTTRYYEGWYDAAYPGDVVSDGSIKATIVERLHENRHTSGERIRVDVKRGVVILGGDVRSTVAKRAAGDDAWDTMGVVDVSNQLTVHGVDVDEDDLPRVRQTRRAEHRQPNGAALVRQVMTPDPTVLPADATALEAARRMRDGDIGDVLVTAHDGIVIGIVTDRDIVVRLCAEGGRPVGSVRLEEFCTTDLVSVSPDDEIGHAVDLMRTHAVRRMPVLDEGRAAGIVSLGDLALWRDPASALADISAAGPSR